MVVIIIVAAAAVYVGFGGSNDGNDDGNSDVHAVTLDGVVASEDNVLNGTYPIQRNLIVCTLGEPTGNVKNFIVDKRTGKGAYMHLVNDFLGNEEIPVSSFDRNFPPYPNFRDGYYILNQDPGNLRERLENSLRKGDCIESVSGPGR